MPYTQMTLEDAAEYLHLPVEDVRTLATHGEIPSHRQGDRIVFLRGELKPWVSQRVLGLRGKHLHDYHSRGILREHDLSDGVPLLDQLSRSSWCACGLACRSRASVLRAMVTLAEGTGLLYDPRDLTDELLRREELCSTGIEGGAALLHPRHHDPYMVDDSFICVGRTVAPIPFGASDGGLTDVFFLICCQDDRTHLHALARVCVLCHSGELLASLRRAETGAEMHRVLLAAERALPGISPSGD